MIAAADAAGATAAAEAEVPVASVTRAAAKGADISSAAGRGGNKAALGTGKSASSARRGSTVVSRVSRGTDRDGGAAMGGRGDDTVAVSELAMKQSSDFVRVDVPLEFPALTGYQFAAQCLRCRMTDVGVVA